MPADTALNNLLGQGGDQTNIAAAQNLVRLPLPLDALVKQ